MDNIGTLISASKLSVHQLKHGELSGNTIDIERKDCIYIMVMPRYLDEGQGSHLLSTAQVESARRVPEEYLV